MRRKHHASLKEKIEGKIEMKVGEKMHNPAMGESSVCLDRLVTEVVVLVQSHKAKPSTRGTAGRHSKSCLVVL